MALEPFRVTIDDKEIEVAKYGFYLRDQPFMLLEDKQGVYFIHASNDVLINRIKQLAGKRGAPEVNNVMDFAQKKAQALGQMFADALIPQGVAVDEEKQADWTFFRLPKKMKLEDTAARIEKAGADFAPDEVEMLVRMAFNDLSRTLANVDSVEAEFPREYIDAVVGMIAQYHEMKPDASSDDWKKTLKEPMQAVMAQIFPEGHRKNAYVNRFSEMLASSLCNDGIELY